MTIPPKQVHKLVTTTAFRLDLTPRELYHELTDRLSQEEGVTLTRTRKETRLKCITRYKLFVPYLTLLMKYYREGMSKTRNAKILTGHVDKVQLSGTRYYVTEAGSFPSVTAILNAEDSPFKDKYIQKWKDNLVRDLGAKKAKNTIGLSTKVGDFHHAMLENWALETDPDLRHRYVMRSTVRFMAEFLDQIKEVIAVEYPVYHQKYQYAGTVDCIARMKDGKVYILDWKTSAKAKNKSGIKNYYYQCAAYALAFYDRTGIKVDGFKIAVTYRTLVGKRKPRRFDLFECDEIREYLDVFLEKAEQYHSKNEVYTPF